MVGRDRGQVPATLEAPIRRLLGKGELLDPALSKQLHDALGHDLKCIRIHRDAESDWICRRLGAHALTLGWDLFFRESAYDPDSAHGRELIGHEVIHALQQDAGRVRGRTDRMTIQSADDPLEYEAEKLGRIAATGGARCLVKVIADWAPTAARSAGPAGWGLTIQRSAQQMANGAQIQPPAAAMPLRYGPTTCNEAAVGWLLKAEGYTHPWQLMREVANTFMMPNSISSWLRLVYSASGRRMNRLDITNAVPSPGDLLHTVTQGTLNVHHSMVVVAVGGGHVWIRGFNNGATFNLPAPAVMAVPAPFGAYDATNRNVADQNLWHGFAPNQTFGAQAPGVELRLITYVDLATSIRNSLRHWTYSVLRTPGWQHTQAVGPGCQILHCPH
jgi:hypothetical protein